MKNAARPNPKVPYAFLSVIGFVGAFAWFKIYIEAQEIRFISLAVGSFFIEVISISLAVHCLKMAAVQHILVLQEREARNPERRV